MEDIKKTDDKVGQRSFLKPLLIILVLVILLGGGYFVYTNYFQNSSDTETASTVTPVVTATPRATATLAASPTASSETASWNTYTSTTGKYTIKYPTDWGYDATQVGITRIDSPATLKIISDITSGKREPFGYSHDINITYNEKITDGTTVFNSLSEFISSGPYTEMKEITFAGQKAYEGIMGGYDAYYTVLLVKDSHLYQIYFGLKEIKSKLSSTETLILNSFQFTN